MPAFMIARPANQDLRAIAEFLLPSGSLIDPDVAIANGCAIRRRLVDDSRISRLRAAGFVSAQFELDNIANLDLRRRAISNCEV